METSMEELKNMTPDDFQHFAGMIYNRATRKVSENPEQYKEDIHEVQR